MMVKNHRAKFPERMESREVTGVWGLSSGRVCGTEALGWRGR